ncbi:MAG: hypothetical protein AB8H80_18310 [Planctomycetota bacterium]
MSTPSRSAARAARRRRFSPVGTALPALAALLALTSAGALAGQESGQRAPIPRKRTSSASIALHEAWIKEVLDLDPRGAVQGYDRIRRSAPRKQPERWLAITRMLELDRLGVTKPEPSVVPRNAPSRVQDALQTLETPVPIEDLLAAPGTEIELPSLRAATRMVQEWVRDQIGPTASERVRLLRDRQARSQPSRSTTSRDPRSAARLSNWLARAILRVELEGRRSQAEAMRQVDFPGWLPPAIVDDAATVRRRAGERLSAWIDTEDSSRTRLMLMELQRSLKDSRSDEEVVALLRRLPIIGERLLTQGANAQPAASEAAKPGSGKATGTGDKK